MSAQTNGAKAHHPYAHIPEAAQIRAALENNVSTEKMYAEEIERLREEKQDLVRKLAVLDPENDGRDAEIKPDRSVVGTWLGPPEIFGPLPAVNAVLSELDISVGAPVIVAGFGYSMKTLSCQSFVTALAAGCRVWDRFDVGTTLRRVAHVDGEQGRRLTCERYQRLAHGMGIDPADLGDRVQLVVMPTVRLDSPNALDAWCKALDGFDVAFFDSLRALAPSIEENSSDIRQPLDMLGAVSEKTGCANLVIHHARKPQKDSPGGAKMAIRGSGAIFDAASSVLIFGGDKGKPVLVQHEKARNTGLPHDDFQLSVEDVANAEGDPRWGLRVVAADVPEAPTANERFAGIKARILEACRTEDLGSKNAIARSVGGTKSTVLEAIGELMTEGALTYVSDRFRPKGSK
jgi:hypothetical protein